MYTVYDLTAKDAKFTLKLPNTHILNTLWSFEHLGGSLGDTLA
jgi:hypothetical protein